MADFVEQLSNLQRTGSMDDAAPVAPDPPQAPPAMLNYQPNLMDIGRAALQTAGGGGTFADNFASMQNNKLKQAQAEYELQSSDDAREMQKAQLIVQQAKIHADAGNAKYKYFTDALSQYKDLAPQDLAKVVNRAMELGEQHPDDAHPESALGLVSQAVQELGIREAPKSDQFRVVGGALIDTSSGTPRVVYQNTKDNAASAPSGYRYAEDGNLEPIPGGPADKGGGGGVGFKTDSNLRKEYLAQSKDYIQLRDTYNNIKAAAQNPSPAGDRALIYSYMRMLDPGSVVREGEFANAQNAAGVPDRVVNMYNAVLNGELLNPAQRNDFLGQARQLLGARVKTQRQTNERYSGLAKQYGSDPSRIVFDIPDPDPGTGSPAPSGGRAIALPSEIKPDDFDQNDIKAELKRRGL